LLSSLLCYGDAIARRLRRVNPASLVPAFAGLACTSTRPRYKLPARLQNLFGHGINSFILIIAFISTSKLPKQPCWNIHCMQTPVYVFFAYPIHRVPGREPWKVPYCILMHASPSSDVSSLIFPVIKRSRRAREPSVITISCVFVAEILTIDLPWLHSFSRHLRTSPSCRQDHAQPRTTLAATQPTPVPDTRGTAPCPNRGNPLPPTPVSKTRKCSSYCTHRPNMQVRCP